MRGALRFPPGRGEEQGGGGGGSGGIEPRNCLAGPGETGATKCCLAKAEPCVWFLALSEPLARYVTIPAISSWFKRERGFGYKYPLQSGGKHCRQIASVAGAASTPLFFPSLAQRHWLGGRDLGQLCPTLAGD